ncbi:mechanosensitive ion channel family protein [Flagellimonas taeanensis]|jgi:miniconductance mechanosensitive channel|uniref:mechanosensitive ion channel family protein n=1 Tax=Flavobacteriaceae TaxID=49546 RepID=UPI000E680738|nr:MULTISPECIES: mechanosensitive ion channel domain-containing protein [Allomuricauda]MDC6386733.1 mechanosensitive ion channel [Muricauda sp. SK9]MEE1964406.1 mechanosensitive ion channel domain-containing protein [Allomuricauda taeanensis]RIV49967.1 mechanosensitive ion channel family protein [Allomuricauda taeanensis]
MDSDLGRLLYDYLLKMGMSEGLASDLNFVLLLVVVLVLAFLLDLVVWKVLRAISIRLARRTKNNYDNFLVAHKVPRSVAHIFPLLFLFEFLPVVFVDFDYAGGIALKIVKILFVLQTLAVFRRFFKSTKDYLKILPKFKDKPIASYTQVFMIFAWIVGMLTIFVIVTETSIWKFFATLGAASAVVLLIFKDSILGFVASIQVTINDMVRIGDWITFDKYGADGDVIEITLATVKVQNFDKTITTIPTYALISDSFKNWRGMQVSGGRRIKRALIISQKSIRFLTQEDVEALKKIQLVADYLSQRSEQITTYNRDNGINKELLINGRNLTNFGVFRKYVTNYLEKHSAINKKMTLMVRQLEPTPQGIPLEIYVFSADKRWENYEYVMADIFDHLLAALPYFSLEIFELPMYVNGKK